jgi:hypothetical protein
MEPSFFVKDLKEYYNPKPPSGFTVTISNGMKMLTDNLHTLTRLYSFYTYIPTLLFENMLWIIPLALGLILSVIGLINSKGSSTGSLFLFLMILCLLGNAML